jgi:hypothetical protein
VWTVGVHTSRSAIAFCHRSPQPAAPQSLPRPAIPIAPRPAASRPAIPAPQSPSTIRWKVLADGRCSPLESYQVRCRWKVPAPQRRMEGPHARTPAGRLSGPLPLEGARLAAENGRSSRPHARTPAGRSLIERTRMEGHRIWMEDADGRSVAKSRGSATSSSVTVNGMSEISAQVRQWKADLPFMDFPSALKNSRRQ